jgi:hypothetical protein
MRRYFRGICQCGRQRRRPVLQPRVPRSFQVPGGAGSAMHALWRVVHGTLRERPSEVLRTGMRSGVV